MTNYVSNAFSLGMVKSEHLHRIRLKPLSGPPENKDECYSVVGHPDTAAKLGVKFNRESITLVPGDVLYVAQLQDGRLPEGCTVLPQTATIGWVEVSFCD